MSETERFRERCHRSILCQAEDHQPACNSTEALAARLGCSPQEIVAWPWTTASPGRYVRVETVERLLRGDE